MGEWLLPVVLPSSLGRCVGGHAHFPSMRPRRGVVAISLALTILLLMFALLVAFLARIAVSGLQVENAERAAQALYAAEAGMDIALQTGSGSITGQVGRARYAVKRRGGEITAVGQVDRAAGAPIRCAITARASGSGIARGSWRQVPPASVQDVAGMLTRPAEERGEVR